MAYWCNWQHATLWMSSTLFKSRMRYKIKNKQTMTNLVGKKVVLSKVSDDRFNGSHPNGINAGYTFEGTVTSDDPMLVVENGLRGFHTSLVRSIEQDGNIYTVKTMNSTYKVEVV